MTQAELDALCEALRTQGLTWSQTNFAVLLMRLVPVVRAARECADAYTAMRSDTAMPGHVLRRNHDDAAQALRAAIDALDAT